MCISISFQLSLYIYLKIMEMNAQHVLVFFFHFLIEAHLYSFFYAA